LLKGVLKTVTEVDKFPFLTNYIIFKNARIAVATSECLGAYLSPGTVIMPTVF